MSCLIPKLKTVNYFIEKQKFKGTMLMHVKYIFDRRLSKLPGHRIHSNALQKLC